MMVLVTTGEVQKTGSATDREGISKTSTEVQKTGSATGGEGISRMSHANERHWYHINKRRSCG